MTLVALATLVSMPTETHAQAAPRTRPRAADDPAPRAPPTAAPASVSRARRHFEQGTRFYRTGRLPEALAAFTHARALAPSAELDYNLALVLERMGRAQESAGHYRRYLRSGEVTADERATIEARIAELEALAGRQRSQTAKPPPTDIELTAEARAFFVRGVKLYKQGKYGQALVAFGAAQRFARVPELAYNMALAEERQGHAQRAIDHYRAYLSDNRDAADRDDVQARIEALLVRRERHAERTRKRAR